jgi:hypothetical protein
MIGDGSEGCQGQAAGRSWLLQKNPLHPTMSMYIVDINALHRPPPGASWKVSAPEG